ncbi:Stk1 family PASTA domain-containing Ser/Thr kinase [Paenibacillus nasutitermitis]|uniref:Serine/threonine-protein kinase PrkC n=1 Tax=Paenibacillus nasutitermitis TaxID=1652958 RepID=A0A916YX05_9BACL|nr:Stk1 family PASTA domain-containing Ser/Thr kinase [Paenibacillus nasutitermitis]GGD65000.1 serine/threonine-protein kinase PrkC [Paenibacillus nasutitermitis]
MIGHELAGRYEIITRIGGGGMALVYKAHDILLNRKVAVKILRQQFVHDEEFIRRFRREAQSAGALSHPNVVSIYDVGQEDDTHYIVMEYVEGHNLNEIIQQRAPLQVEEAVRIAIQICDALEHAHHNQIIHRDIKPHNILIGKNGRVKVTDFGIARAVTSSTITQTGSVMGSVHYFSPEHAKGISTGEKSDLYSLGIVLYQMLTGKLPFLGESPISVALKHLQETFEEPRIVNPYIPQSVENVILRAMRKNPNERYHSADEMLRDLETCLQPERLKESKITFVGGSDFDETRVMPAIRGSITETLAASGTGSRADRTVASDKAVSSDTEENRWNSTGLVEAKNKRKWVKPLITVLVTLLVIALVYWGARTVLGWFDIKEVDVPYVINKTEEEARISLEQAGLKVEEPTVYTEKADIAEGTVYEQSKANQRVKVGSFIKLYVSKGPKLEGVLDYTGKPYSEVVESLTALGVSEQRIIKDPNEVFSEQAPGTVIEQKPAAGEQFDPNKAVFTFIVSKGKETFPMPDVIGKKEKDAIAELEAKGLVVKAKDIVREGSYKEQGTVLSQYPFEPKTTVSKGDEITLTISSGYPEDALEFKFDVTVSPAVAGQSSEVRITYTDARGQNIEWGKKTIKNTQTFSVKVVLDPNTEAMVSVFRDSQFVDTFARTYEEVKAGPDSIQETIPGTEPPPENEPAQTEETDDNGESSTNTTDQTQQ